MEMSSDQSCETCDYFRPVISAKKILNFGKCICPIPDSVSMYEKRMPTKDAMMMNGDGKTCAAWKVINVN